MQRLYDKDINGHWIYLTDENIPLIIPSLYSRYTHQRGVSIQLRVKRDRVLNGIEHSFEEEEIGSEGQYVRGNQLGLFLEWVESRNKLGSQISLVNHTALPSDVINAYINDYLIKEKGKGETTVERAVYSLKSYYNWLHYYLNNNYKEIYVFSENREICRNNNKKRLVVKYLLPETRELIYRYTETLLEEIVLRNGGDLGCRTAENQGFLLNDFYEGRRKYKGILTLMKELKRDSYSEEFEYHLPSLFAKRGSSRTLYIPRAMLIKIKTYYELERPHSDSEHLLISNSSNNSKGKCISRSFGTAVFKKTLKKLIPEIKENEEIYGNFQNITLDSVYHHLRHSFGTDVFYGECEARGKDYESISTESVVFLETARRMGHKVDGRYVNQVTKTYIHSCGHRDRLMCESMSVEAANTQSRGG
ncbi:site-specific integrase [Vibrio sp. SCSIO 43140]|uniref:site-specific integrase n=1 Tax=Vibrio sp. SCSIO 43140 TaxID=2819100 RepID=UPI002075905B|nr:site-specific integrase [Vibrio sp. SCSIO 43140]USD58778.1 site-specific integrase [Vibrio sp. SCSIO 43140]USD59112.1 site-specific integrase [Vibrio sp. SCSIO 43140]USD59736.1 site-specific integrase [Vibrio sp. SCSIO 43140]